MYLRLRMVRIFNAARRQFTVREENASSRCTLCHRPVPASRADQIPCAGETIGLVRISPGVRGHPARLSHLDYVQTLRAGIICSRRVFFTHIHVFCLYFFIFVWANWASTNCINHVTFQYKSCILTDDHATLQIDVKTSWTAGCLHLPGSVKEGRPYCGSFMGASAAGERLSHVCVRYGHSRARHAAGDQATCGPASRC